MNTYDLYDVGPATDIMILSTANQHYKGIQRLPDRDQSGTPVAAYQVQTPDQARDVFRRFDATRYSLYVDVERKQNLDLIKLARATVKNARIHIIKPNDITVDACFALLDHHIGHGITNATVTVVGAGNIGFKLALRLAEVGAKVGLTGRDPARVYRLVDAANTALPRFTPHKVANRPIPNSNVLISAVAAADIITQDHIAILAPEGALCIDVGIGNLAPTFIREATRHGHTCVRLDVRSAGNPLPSHPNSFFSDVAGRTRIGESDLVAGGLIGMRGEVVVDAIKGPRKIIGLASGTGTLIPEDDWTQEQRTRVAELRNVIQANRPREA
ncbi:hypothetical protein [Janibacter terrae]|uniref:hypothetical protein n=1 Tax=Janibacter terrae TaxID=103817 RepID=UPI0031F9286D